LSARSVRESVETARALESLPAVVEVPLRGPAEVAGIPLPDAMVEQLRAGGRIEPVLVDDDGVPVAVGRQGTALSPKIVRAVLLRDGHCRVPGCEIRHGLEVHHLRPRSRGGSDDPSNLATVCRPGGHHGMLVPTGRWALVGNPNRPDGLRLVRLDELTDDQATQLGRPPPRANPAA
jgi:HNH endonuclease